MMFESFYDNELTPECCKAVNISTHFFAILLPMANLLNLIYKFNRILEIDLCSFSNLSFLIICLRETNFTLAVEPPFPSPKYYVVR